MDVLIDWDQTREMPFIFPWKKKKNLWYTTNVTTSITI